MAEIIRGNTNLTTQKAPFSVELHKDGMKKLINDTLGDQKVAQRFIANITGVVSINPMLQKCTTGSIVSAGLQAESLNLPLNQTLGYAYVIPYGDKAQFQIGYKGLVQLAIRTGQYKDIDVFVIKDGEYKGRDTKTGRPLFEFIQSDEEWEAKETIGYMATFETVYGFSKQLYWSKEKAQAHAKRYSKSYGTGKTTDLWTNQFDLMAMKTVLKQLLSKFGILSTDLQQAIEADQAVIDEKGNKIYVDNDYSENTLVETEIEVEPIKDTKETKTSPKSPKNSVKSDDGDTPDLFNEQFEEF